MSRVLLANEGLGCHPRAYTCKNPGGDYEKTRKGLSKVNLNFGGLSPPYFVAKMVVIVTSF